MATGFMPRLGCREMVIRDGYIQHHFGHSLGCHINHPDGRDSDKKFVLGGRNFLCVCYVVTLLMLLLGGYVEDVTGYLFL